jgi:hypothetical protein
MDGKPVPEHLIRHKLMSDVHPQYVGVAIDAMLNAGWITAVGGSAPARVFIPNRLEAG